MQVFFQIIAARIAPMAVKNREVACSYIAMDPQILKNLKCVLHSRSLSYVAKNSSVESLHIKLETPNYKCIVWFKIMNLGGFKFPINPLVCFNVSV
jgi:hypothetical protein